ncbi:MAG: acyltransferase family protein [Janthinobacterium lividum]
MEPEVRKTPVRYYEIDLLRFIAAISVVLYHYTYWGPASPGYVPFPFADIGRVSRYGYLGVELFFMISGYVVLLSAQGKTVRQFFLSRVTRLYPAYWAACTLTFLVERVWGPKATDVGMTPTLAPSLKQYLCNMTMLHDFIGVVAIDTAYWSLTIEITFYFLIAVLIGFKLLQHIEWFLTAWLAYAAYPGQSPSNTQFGMLFFPNYAPYFMVGMLFYLLQQRQGRTPWRYALLVGACLLSLRIGARKAVEISAALHGDTSWKVAVLLICSFFLTFYLVSFRKVNLSRFTWLAWLGALTYPLYLLHSSIGYIVFHRLGGRVDHHVLLLGMLATVLVLTYLLHTLVERRFSKLLGQKVSALLARA